MMQYRLLFILLFISVSCKAQEAKKVQMEGVVVHEYYKTSAGVYCEGPTYFIDGKDTFVLFSRIDYNQDILEQYPDLQKELGMAEKYFSDPFQMDSLVDLHYVRFNKYQFREGKTFVGSNAFYQDSRPKMLFTLYQLKATFIRYSGIFRYVLNTFNVGKSGKDCICPGISLMNTSKDFLVLEKVEAVKKLTGQQEQKMNLKPTGMKSIELFYPE
ncbi:hypothetical protein [Prolixibacter sp. NT017]|uniref:hypothetical protein n=1 Tax=Prolixibacter sp. NT017 TaxID=2652390 RepID=UPI001275900B|nr:hypothetical protein [Prolixibacter sp. NT017]GET25043.1 hypothetical protein NT017_13720 [Prolixibacter sp. NT017]